jgi:hypothetical protein
MGPPTGVKTTGKTTGSRRDQTGNRGTGQSVEGVEEHDEEQDNAQEGVNVAVPQEPAAQELAAQTVQDASMATPVRQLKQQFSDEAKQDDGELANAQHEAELERKHEAQRQEWIQDKRNYPTQEERRRVVAAVNRKEEEVKNKMKIGQEKRDALKKKEEEAREAAEGGTHTATASGSASAAAAPPAAATAVTAGKSMYPAAMNVKRTTGSTEEMKPVSSTPVRATSQQAAVAEPPQMTEQERRRTEESKRKVKRMEDRMQETEDKLVTGEGLANLDVVKQMRSMQQEMKDLREEYGEMQEQIIEPKCELVAARHRDEERTGRNPAQDGIKSIARQEHLQRGRQGEGRGMGHGGVQQDMQISGCSRMGSLPL